MSRSCVTTSVEIYYDAGRDDVEYVFGDQITAISDDGDVSFEHGAPRQLRPRHRRRRTAFRSAPDSCSATTLPERFLDGYLSVVSVPKSLARDGDMTGYFEPDRIAMIYTADHLDDARAVFLFRPRHARTTTTATSHARRTSCAPCSRGMARGGRPLARRSWTARRRSTSTAITQLELTSWSRGRVTLVGDAGYCPGPAVGGSTSLAVYGAYVLAGETREGRWRPCRGVRRVRADHAERAMLPAARRSGLADSRWVERSCTSNDLAAARRSSPGRARLYVRVGSTTRAVSVYAVMSSVRTQSATSARLNRNWASGCTTTCHCPHTQNPPKPLRLGGLA